MYKRNVLNCLCVMICIFYLYQNKYNFFLVFGYVIDSFEDDFLILMKYIIVNIDFKWFIGMVGIYCFVK